jgi:hypothetical protein
MVTQQLGFPVPTSDAPSLMNGPDSTTDGLSLTADRGDGYPRLSKCFGVPFQTSSHTGRSGLFLPFLMGEVECRTEITTLFVRRSFFLALFSHSSPGRNSTSRTVHPGPNLSLDAVPRHEHQPSQALAPPQASSSPRRDHQLSVELPAPAPGLVVPLGLIMSTWRSRTKKVFLVVARRTE